MEEIQREGLMADARLGCFPQIVSSQNGYGVLVLLLLLFLLLLLLRLQLLLQLMLLL